MCVPLRLPAFHPPQAAEAISKAIADLIDNNKYEICDLAKRAGIDATLMARDEGSARRLMSFGLAIEGSDESLLMVPEVDGVEGTFGDELLTALEWGEKRGWRDALVVHVLIKQLAVNKKR